MVLAVFLLVWLLPKPNLNPLYDRVFADNIQMIKEAAKSYYTVERLPKEVDQTVKMTLDQMIADKLVLTIVDSKGNTCDGQASYVEVRKTETEYLIKTSLTCSDRTDYVIEHFGCYDICNNTCVPTEKPVVKSTSTKKTTNTVVKKEVQPEPVITIINENKNIINNNVPPAPTPTPKPTPKPTQKTYEYTYRKYITTNYGDWSPWSNEIRYVDADKIQFGCTNTKCVEVAPNSPRLETVGTKTTTTTVYATDSKGNKIELPKRDKKDSLITTYQVQACANYDYIIYDSGTYQYTAGAQWSGPTVVKVYSMPDDTPTEHYELIKAGYDEGCVGECKSDFLLVNKYTRTATKVSTSTSASSIQVTCSNVVTKTVPVYGPHYVFDGYKVDHYNVVKTDIKGYVKYYRYKTKVQKTSSHYVYEIRSYYDYALINAGYELISTVEK